MSFSTIINPAALQADGSYASLEIVPSQLPAGINTQTMVVIGTRNWGPLGVPTFLSSYDAGNPVMGDTNVALTSTTDYGIMSRVAVADAVCSSFIAIGVGTSAVAASANIQDSAPATVFSLAGAWTGSLGNKIKWVLALQSGTWSVKPVAQLTIIPPYGNPEVFNNIVGYTSSAYAPVTFKANLLAAVNGTNGTPGSKWVIASAGSGVLAPASGSGLLSGGTDGTSGLADSDILGTDGFAGSRTGLYACRGLVAGATVCLAGVNGDNSSTFSAVNAFVQSESCIAVLDYPLGTGTSTAIADRITNGLTSPFIMMLEDWIKVNDPLRGTIWQSPSGAGAGIVASCPPYLYPGNKPRDGMPTVFATESSISVPITVGSTDANERESNGINWMANPMPRGGGTFGLYHGMMSDGVTMCSDVRMGFYIALNIQKILAQFVGEMQTATPDDDTRRDARGAVNAFMNTMLPPNKRQLQAYEDILDETDNNPTTISQGLLLAKVAVTTLGAVRFAVAAIQVGVGVQITIGDVKS